MGQGVVPEVQMRDHRVACGPAVTPPATREAEESGGRKGMRGNAEERPGEGGVRGKEGSPRRKTAARLTVCTFPSTHFTNTDALAETDTLSPRP